MAATFTVYDSFKKNMQDGTLDMDATGFKVVLWKTLAGVSVPTASLAGSLSATQVDSGNGYTTGGAALANNDVTISGSNAKFDADDTFWSANGAGGITSIALFTIQSSNATSANAFRVGWGRFSPPVGSLANTNRLTIQWASTGIYTVS